RKKAVAPARTKALAAAGDRRLQPAIPGLAERRGHAPRDEIAGAGNLAVPPGAEALLRRAACRDHLFLPISASSRARGSVSGRSASASRRCVSRSDLALSASFHTCAAAFAM